MIVFMASCEAVEFLLSLFKSVLCGTSTKHKPLNFLRLHGNMKQEVRESTLHREESYAKGLSARTFLNKYAEKPKLAIGCLN